MKAKGPRFEQGHTGISHSPLAFPREVIGTHVGAMVRGRESQKSSTFVNFSGRPWGDHFPLILKGKAMIGRAARGRSHKAARPLISLYLHRDMRIWMIPESQISSTFVTFTPDGRACALRHRLTSPLRYSTAGCHGSLTTESSPLLIVALGHRRAMG